MYSGSTWRCGLGRVLHSGRSRLGRLRRALTLGRTARRHHMDDAEKYADCERAHDDHDDRLLQRLSVEVPVVVVLHTLNETSCREAGSS